MQKHKKSGDMANFGRDTWNCFLCFRQHDRLWILYRTLPVPPGKETRGIWRDSAEGIIASPRQLRQRRRSQPLSAPGTLPRAES